MVVDTPSVNINTISRTENVRVSHHSLAYSTGYVSPVTEGMSVSSLTGLDIRKVGLP